MTEVDIIPRKNATKWGKLKLLLDSHKESVQKFDRDFPLQFVNKKQRQGPNVPLSEQTKKREEASYKRRLEGTRQKNRKQCLPHEALVDIAPCQA